MVVVVVVVVSSSTTSSGSSSTEVVVVIEVGIVGLCWNNIYSICGGDDDLTYSWWMVRDAPGAHNK